MKYPNEEEILYPKILQIKKKNFIIINSKKYFIDFINFPLKVL